MWRQGARIPVPVPAAVERLCIGGAADLQEFAAGRPHHPDQPPVRSSRHRIEWHASQQRWAHAYELVQRCRGPSKPERALPDGALEMDEPEDQLRLLVAAQDILPDEACLQPRGRHHHQHEDQRDEEAPTPAPGPPGSHAHHHHSAHPCFRSHSSDETARADARSCRPGPDGSGSRTIRRAGDPDVLELPSRSSPAACSSTRRAG